MIKIENLKSGADIEKDEALRPLLNYIKDWLNQPINLTEWGFPDLIYQANITTDEAVDIGLRHKYPRAEPFDYLKQWLSISRQFAYATHDDSWGEFEKEFAIIISRLVSAERRVKELELTIK